jgi:hypothetical protein
MNPKQTQSFAQINRNFCNYPIARDSHVRPRWGKGKNTGRWLCDLPGDNRIKLQLPSNADPSLRRCPSAFDVNVLFTLLRLAKMQDRSTIVFRSHADILQTMGWSSSETRSYHALKRALALWSALSLRIDRWWTLGRGNVGIKLEPPISRIDRPSGRVHITLDEEWCSLAKRFFVKAHLPLPNRAPAQNLVLWLLTMPRSPTGENTWVVNPNHKLTERKLCKKIGINHRTRNSVLKRAIEAAKEWFAKRGKMLEMIMVNQEGHIGFVVARPKKKTRPKNTTIPKPKPRKLKAITYKVLSPIPDRYLWEYR